MDVQLTPDQQAFIRQAIESGRFQHEEDVIAGSFNLADRFRDPIGLGKGIVDGVSQFLHEVL